MKILSRRTVNWLALVVISVAYLTYRIPEFQRSCSEYVQTHRYRPSASEPFQSKADSNGSTFVGLDPCSYEDPSPVDERVVTLIAVISVPVFFGSLIRDLLRRRRFV